MPEERKIMLHNGNRWGSGRQGIMNGANPGSRRKPLRLASACGAIAGFITAVTVAWLTPDGNLVVTLVPALAVGLVAFALAAWCWRSGRPMR